MHAHVCGTSDTNRKNYETRDPQLKPARNMPDSRSKAGPDPRTTGLAIPLLSGDRFLIAVIVPHSPSPDVMRITFERTERDLEDLTMKESRSDYCLTAQGTVRFVEDSGWCNSSRSTMVIHLISCGLPEKLRLRVLFPSRGQSKLTPAQLQTEVSCLCRRTCWMDIKCLPRDATLG